MILKLQTAFPCVLLQYATRLKAEMLFLNIAKGTTDPSVEFSLAKVTFLGHINFKISTEHQILMSTDGRVVRMFSAILGQMEDILIISRCVIAALDNLNTW